MVFPQAPIRYHFRMDAPNHLPVIADRFKRSIIAETAMRLASAHGRRKMYSADEVKAAIGAAHFPAAWAGWAVAVFCTGAEFADYCARQNLAADYQATRTEAMQFIDRPLAPAAGVAAAGAAAALAAGPASGSDNPSAADLAGDALDIAETGVDVVGGLFEVLGIFD